MNRIEEFWKAYLKQSFQSESMAYAEVFSFGHGEQMADSLSVHRAMDKHGLTERKQ